MGKSKSTIVCFFLFFLIFHLFTCGCIVWVISAPWHSLSPSPPFFPSVPGRPCSAFITSFIGEKRQAVKDSCPEIFLALLLCTRVMTHVDSSLIDLYPGYWSPSHDNLCCFRVSVLAPLEWGHKMLSCFGFSTYFWITHMLSPLVMWPQSKHIATFALDLKSAYEGEHTIFGLLSLADLTQNDVL
jgi:hypothetical protein